MPGSKGRHGVLHAMHNMPLLQPNTRGIPRSFLCIAPAVPLFLVSGSVVKAQSSRKRVVYGTALAFLWVVLQQASVQSTSLQLEIAYNQVSKKQWEPRPPEHYRFLCEKLNTPKHRLVMGLKFPEQR